MKTNKEWLSYRNLMKTRPEEFRNNGEIVIVTDEAIVEEYEQKTGKIIGVHYQSPYRLLVVDLVYEKEGEYFTYERLLPAGTDGTAVVCVPYFKDKYILIKQYRHAMRNYQYAFPRGYGEPGLSGKENAAKETSEELGATVQSVTHLGSVISDSGASGGKAELYLCSVSSYQTMTGYEGITDTLEVSFEELTNLILDGKINDGYTLSAYAFLVAQKKEF